MSDFEYTLPDDYDFADNDSFSQEEAEIKLHELLFAKCLTIGAKLVYDYIRKGRAKKARLTYNRSERLWELRKRDSGNKWYTESCCSAGLYGKKVLPEFLNACLGILDLGELTELEERIYRKSEWR